MPYSLVLTTVPDRREARRLARRVLTARLAACVGIVPAVESYYWWKGKIEESRELLLLIKTKASAYKNLEKIIRDNHPYDTPEILALPVQKGSEKYLKWLSGEVRSKK